MAHRIIARLDIKGENVVRGIHLEGLRVVGRPEEMAAQYAADGIDEIVFIDTVATLYGRNNAVSVVRRTAERVFIPMTVGGGIAGPADVEAALRAGADKVTLNSAAVRLPSLITDLARRFGSQCIVSLIEVKQSVPGRWTVLTENGRQATGLDAIEWARRCCDLGAGELLITSIDRDGTRRGCDIGLMTEIARVATVPVIASGGPSKPEHVVAVLRAGLADAVALGTLLHFGLSSVAAVKTEVAAAGLAVRPAPQGGGLTVDPGTGRT
jgi:cyclase